MRAVSRFLILILIVLAMGVGGSLHAARSPGRAALVTGLGLTTEATPQDVRRGDTLTVRALLTRGAATGPVDAYLVVRLPGGEHLSLTPSGLVSGFRPYARSFVPVDYSGVVTSLTVPAGAPVGTYVLLSALTTPGTLDIVSPIAESRFTIGSSAARLLQLSDFSYEGAFRMPSGTFGGSSFDYGGTSIAFNATRGSLFVVGHDWDQEVAEIAVPEVRVSSGIAGLSTASVLQSFTDPTEGAIGRVGSGSIKVGGLLPYQGRLHLTAYVYYDASASQTHSHFASGLDFGVTGDAHGPHRVGSLAAGFVSGYFGLVPSEWQAALGGPVLNGNCCLSIISRTSYGPSVSAIDPETIGAADPAPAQALLYYPSTHPLAEWNSTSTLFNGASEVRGVVFPDGAASVLFFGRQGIGPFCYGTGEECNDPADSYKGTHAYPYRYYIWAYDATDLAAVRAGTRAAWSLRPYAVWAIPLPFARENARILGATWDPATRRVFVSQAHGDGDRPLVHVFRVR